MYICIYIHIYIHTLICPFLPFLRSAGVKLQLSPKFTTIVNRSLLENIELWSPDAAGRSIYTVCVCLSS